MRWRVLLLLNLLTAMGVLSGDELERRGLEGLEVVRFEQLSDPYVAALGAEALQIRKGEWLHAETQNFVYHFFAAFEGSPTSIATPVATEAEFYYRVFAEELGKDSKRWERKSHIFIFDRDEDWLAFQKKARLDPWTGGIHAQGELFLPRRRESRFKGHALGHEIAHLVLYRFYGGDIPLWLNEGYAEYASRRAHASYQRARGYAAKPSSPPLKHCELLPLTELTSLRAYPDTPERVSAFYRQSEKLTRFLAGRDKRAFIHFFDLMAGGSKFESAIRVAYATDFRSVGGLEKEFIEFATNEIVAR